MQHVVGELRYAQRSNRVHRKKQEHFICTEIIMWQVKTQSICKSEMVLMKVFSGLESLHFTGLFNFSLISKKRESMEHFVSFQLLLWISYPPFCSSFASFIFKKENNELFKKGKWGWITPCVLKIISLNYYSIHSENYIKPLRPV
jgi:hypothetical protein